MAYVPVTQKFYDNLIKPAHQGQLYGDKPYTFHLRTVLKTWHSLFEPTYTWGESEEETKATIHWCYNAGFACLAHDYLEDCEGASVELLREHGCPKEAIEAVVLVTKTKEKSYKQYLRDISENKLAFEVKMADTYSNLTCSIKEGNLRRMKRYSLQLALLTKYRETFTLLGE